MSFNEVAIQAENLSKKYQIYEKPSDRLKQSLFKGKKYYREFDALKNVSFKVEKGQTFGIIGQNGSGKSTLLQMLANTLEPTTGTLQVNGRVAALLELGSGFNPEYTGRENVYMNGSILGVTKEQMDQRFKDIEEFADIGEFIDQPVKTYSSGMYVRLAFSVAINVDADILIVDEALAVGDVFFQVKCYKKFEEFKKQGKTILLVTHDLGSVMKYCDNVLVLNYGDSMGILPAKEAVDLYKKLVVDLHKSKQPSVEELEKTETKKDIINWKVNYPANSEKIEYGNGDAFIIDYAIFDTLGELTSTIDKGATYIIKLKIKFERTIKAPIFAMTIKDLKGTEITGTNTMIENVSPEIVQAGDVIEVHFKQEMNIQGGSYMLSFGCTGFENGEFVVYHRLYDELIFQVISTKNTVGYFDLKSEVSLFTL